MSVQTDLFERDGSANRTKPAAKVEESVGRRFDVKQFIANFDVIAEAAGSVVTLRRFVLTLAVTGRLTEQLPDDGDARSLRTTLRAGNERAAKKTSNATEEVSDGLSQLPASWCWARFLDVASIDSCLVDPGKFMDAPHVAPDNIEKGTGRLLDYRTVREDGVTSNKHRFFPGQIVYSKIRPNLSKAAVVDFDGVCSADMYPITSKIDRAYLHRYMLSTAFLKQVVKDDNRLAMPKVNQEQLGGTLVALPPLAEQKRIVAKVDQLMALCDELEARQTKKRETGTRLTKSALEALTSADGPDEFETAWKRVLENFDVLVSRADSVREIRKAVLDLAVRGHLTHHRSTFRSDGPFAVPAHWEWRRGSEVFPYITSGSRGWAQYYSDHGPMFLRIGNLDYERITLDLRSIQRVRPPENAEGVRTRVAAGDVLISITGDTGMVGLVPQDLGEAYINQHIALCRPGPGTVPEFVARVLTAPPLLGRLQSAQRGIKNSLGLEDVRAMMVPVPPVDEQRLVLGRLHALTSLIDDLEVRLRRSEDRATKLVEAVIQELVA